MNGEGGERVLTGGRPYYREQHENKGREADRRIEGRTILRSGQNWS